MTIAEIPPGGAVAIPDYMTAGLEDVEASDLVMPRVNIDHKTAEYVNSLSGERYASLDCIVLGLIKGYVLWPAKQGDNDVPLCKSLDHKIGRPEEGFPWEAAGFDQAALPVDPITGGPCASCADCPLKEWNSHPTEGKPWCSEQYTFVLLLPDGRGGYGGAALLTLQRSAIKATKGYITAFQSISSPMFVAVTTLGLTPEKRGSNQYATPTFVKGVPTDESNWQEWADKYRGIRQFLQTVRPPMDDETAPAPTAATSTTAEGEKAEDRYVDPEAVPF